MKRSFCKLSFLLSIFALVSSAPSIQAISMPSMSSFKLSGLNTPEAVSNALSRLSSAFSWLSPKTLASIVETQGKKFQENMNAYIKNPSLAKGGAAAANALAATAAALALAGEAAAIAGAATVGAGLGYHASKKAGIVKEKEAEPTSTFGMPME